MAKEEEAGKNEIRTFDTIEATVVSSK